MRTDVPPPGKSMTFPEWSAAIVAGVRAFLPDVRAARKGARVVIIRHGDREARLEAGASFWITFPAGEMKTTMASLVDDRRDSFTVSNLAHSPDISIRGSPAKRQQAGHTAVTAARDHGCQKERAACLTS
jgi:hypothetical protein